MSTTNFSPHFKGLGQWMTNAVEGSLQGVEVEIQELEQKITVVKGKTKTPRPGERGDSQCPPLLTSPLAIPRPEEPATPAGHGMSRVLKSLSPGEIPQAMSNAENPLEQEGSAEPQPHARVQEAQVRFKEQNPLGTILAKVQWEWWEALRQWAQVRKTKRRDQWA